MPRPSASIVNRIAMFRIVADALAKPRGLGSMAEYLLETVRHLELPEPIPQETEK